ncbi:MAG: thermonuclease family protein [Deltaproteobacteria bacterium]|nr:thermonuclease family protein [Deltaproteobacteria bacterium]
MKKSLLFLAGVLAALALLCLPAFSADRFTITRVYDGDTVQAEAPGVVIYIMLVGIDAPEVGNQVNRQGQPYGKEAKDFLSSMILHRSVDVVGYGVAPYPHDNIIGVIYLEGKNINLEMVKHGLAEVQQANLPKGLDIQPYMEAEKMARARKDGMWSLGSRYMSPRAWRLKHMGDQAEVECK